MNASFAKRGRFEIIYGILSFCRKPLQKTRILYSCNLSYDQLRKYLQHLISLGLLNSIKKSRKEFFQITDKGREYLELYEHLVSLLNRMQNKPVVLRNGYRKEILT